MAGNTARASSVMAPAATAITATVGRHPHAWLIELVSGLPTMSAADDPTYTAVVARPVCVAGTRQAAIGTMVDHIKASVPAHAPRWPASHASPGASADSACATVRHVSVRTKT